MHNNSFFNTVFVGLGSFISSSMVDLITDLNPSLLKDVFATITQFLILIITVIALFKRKKQDNK
jgi:hypothetical protein